MKQASFAEKAQSSSPLMQTQWLKTAGKVAAKKSHTEVLLPLTSLIDAFSIIVIYLLIGTQGGGLEKDIPNQLQLPVATAGQIIDAEMLTVKIIQGRYFINDQFVPLSQLGAELNQARKNFEKDQKSEQKTVNVELLVQADQAMDYAQLDPLLRAGSEAGIQKLKFAVLPKQ